MKLKVLIGLLFLSSPSWAVIALVQHPTGAAATNTVDITLTQGLGTAPRLVVVVANASFAGTVTGVTDNSAGGSNNYVSIPGAASQNAGSGKTTIFYSTTTKSGATTVTITGDASVTSVGGWVLEYTGALTDGTNPVDKSGKLDTQSATTTPVGPSLTITNSGDVIINNANVGGTVSSVNAPWVDETITSGNDTADYLPGATGTYNATFNSDNFTYNSSGAAFLPAAGGAAAVVPQRARRGMGL